MKRASIVVILIALLLVAATPQPLTVYSGETLTLTANTGSRSATDTIAAEFSIPRTEVNYYISETGASSPVLRQRATFDLPPGNYEMRVRTWVNNELTNYDNVQVKVLERESRTSRTTNSTAQPRESTIHIEPIPDATPGTTFIVPVRVTGNGDYLVEVPRLAFGTYEVPERVHVEGTQTVPVLIHIDEDAEPGTYAIPVRVGSEEATARLRIIKYQEDKDLSLWWLLVPLGIILMVIGILLLVSRRTPPPRRIEPVPPPKSDDTDLISYY